MRNKVLVIGLDAADLDVVRPLVERGELPNLGRLMAEGASGVLRSTVPPVSAPAWASFLTGNNPGRHGLYSFVVEREGGGKIQLANMTDIHGPKIWDLVAAQGARPIVANVPVTWPPPAVDGVIVTGMLTPESEGVTFTHPPELSAEILASVPGYRIDVDRALLDDREQLFDAMLEMARVRKELFVHLMTTQPWDLMVAVFTNTDRVQHSFWRNERELVDRFFAAVDEHVGALLELVDLETTTVMVMSDHGFQGAKYKLYMNRLLADHGLLATCRAVELDEHYDRRRPDYFTGFQGGRGEPKQKGGVVRNVLAAVGVGGEMSIDWEHTRAFMWSLDTGGVAVNLKGRYPHGVVEQADYEKVRDEVIALLTDLKLPDGRPAFLSVKRREDVYHGDHVGGAPDVVVEQDDALDFGIQLDATNAIREHKRPLGHHSPRGLVALTGANCKRGTTIEGDLVDCVPTILHALGLAVPAGCDGKVLVDAFSDDRAVRTLDTAVEAADMSASAYSADEEEDLKRSLEGLGYL
jgi:predicted AlkP superfamily phosphohydrolase/phosphomutase